MKTLRLIFLLIIITSCTGRTHQKPVPVIDLQNPGGTKDLYLSELLDDIHVVKLETADEIMLGQYTNYLVGERYIITIDNDKILQFSSKGEFLRTLAKAGNGPEEFLRADAFALDDKKDILYINHRGDSRHILIYDLKTSRRIRRIPTGADNIISQIIVSGDSILTIVPRMNKDKLTRYFISKNDFTVAEIKGFHNDFLGIDEDPDIWDDYLFITNNLGYVCYSSFELKQKIEKTLESKKLDNLIKQRISTLNKQINENDNPILVIGKLK